MFVINLRRRRNSSRACSLRSVNHESRRYPIGRVGLHFRMRAPRYASSQDAPRALWDALLKGDGGKEIEGFLQYPEHQANPTAAVRTEGRSDLWTSIE